MTDQEAAKRHALFWRRARAVDEGTFVRGKVRKHVFEGQDYRQCSKCGSQFSSVIHK